MLNYFKPLYFAPYFNLSVLADVAYSKSTNTPTSIGIVRKLAIWIKSVFYADSIAFRFFGDENILNQICSIVKSFSWPLGHPLRSQKGLQGSEGKHLRTF